MTNSNRTKLVFIGGAAVLATVGAIVALSRRDTTPPPSAETAPSAAAAEASGVDAAKAASTEADASTLVVAERDPAPFERVLVPAFEIARGVDPRVQPAITATQSGVPWDGGDGESADGGASPGGYLVGYASDRGVARVTGVVLGGPKGARTAEVPIAYRPEAARFAQEAPADVTRSIESVSPRDLVTVEGAQRARVVLNARDVGPNAPIVHCGRSDAPPVADLGADSGVPGVTRCHAAATTAGQVVAWTETEATGDGGTAQHSVRVWVSPSVFYELPAVVATKEAPRFLEDEATFIRGSFVHHATPGESPWTVGFPRAVTGAAWGVGTLWVSTGTPQLEGIDVTAEKPKKVPLGINGIHQANGRKDACTPRERRVLGSFSTGTLSRVVVVRETCDRGAYVAAYTTRAEMEPPGKLVNVEVANDSTFLPLPEATVSATFLPIEPSAVERDAASKVTAAKPVLVAYVVKEGESHVLRGMVLRPD